MVSYRSNVAALMLNSQGDLLVCERSTVPGSWQFPQGGVDLGESLKQALYREVLEEIGLAKKDYEVEYSRGGYRYLYPEEVRLKKKKKHGHHGQEQTYYLCKLKKDSAKINVNQTPREFSDFRWIKPSEFDLNWVPKFKREVYQAVMKDFFDLDLGESSNT
ncbi:NUDIX domain-containing protein [Luteolibacter sp. AS25]|uniref:NUDIX domain-containing protein n=1 Tax=Luteolibacter sp. AS25 TaxID=3135776 RepID=UPI00398B0E09